MTALARGETSDCDNPKLKVFTSINGALVDVAVLEFQIFNVVNPSSPVQVFPATGRQSVDPVNLCPLGHKVSTGHYFAPFSIPIDEPIGPHQVHWFFKFTPTSPELTGKTEFEVLAVSASGSLGYIFVADIRAEGVTAIDADDNRVQFLIEKASRFIDRITGRTFLPKTQTIRLDGTGHSTLFLDVPVIGISEIIASVHGISPWDTSVPLSDLVIYNRHLSQGLTEPDDRDDPRISFKTVGDPARYHRLIGPRIFPQGRQNIEITGVFGYTDPDGSPSSSGKTPELIKHAAKLLVLRDVPKLADRDARDDALVAGTGRIKKLRTRDQEIEYFASGGGTQGGAPFTGDAEIDGILSMFMKPMSAGTV